MEEARESQRSETSDDLRSRVVKLMRDKVAFLEDWALSLVTSLRYFMFSDSLGITLLEILYGDLVTEWLFNYSNLVQRRWISGLRTRCTVYK